VLEGVALLIEELALLAAELALLAAELTLLSAELTLAGALWDASKFSDEVPSSPWLPAQAAKLSPKRTIMVQKRILCPHRSFILCLPAMQARFV
jgi:hypothetical protein